MHDSMYSERKEINISTKTTKSNPITLSVPGNVFEMVLLHLVDT